MVEERARIEITSCLAARSRLFERFNNGDVDGHCDYNGVAFFTQGYCEFLACGPFELRHLMLWELQLRRVKLDGAVNVITNLVKKRMGLGECEDAAFYTAMHMFSWWMDECELCTKADATPFFIEWMDDEYYELDLDWEHSNCNPSHPKTRGIAKI